MNKKFNLTSYNYNLPEDRIAQYPLKPAHNSKLLFCKINSHGSIQRENHHSYDLPDLLKKGTLLIANNSQIFQARIPLHNTLLQLKNGTETILNSGEILIIKLIFHRDRSVDQTQCVIRGSDDKHFKIGTIIYIDRDKNIYLHLLQYTTQGILISLHNITLDTLCKQYGHYPLPPYIHNFSQDNQEHYKTSFGTHHGSAATPTAGLHFTPELRKKLNNSGIQRQEITLHVGIATFLPIVANDIRQHTLHSEIVTIPLTLFEMIYTYKSLGKDIISIGTTSIRTIESLPYIYQQLKQSLKLSPQAHQWRANCSHTIQDSSFVLIISQDSNMIVCESKLYIYPGFQRRIINGMVTNFHLPKTSLCVLVAGLIGYKNRKDTYQYALKNNYRFASFGDAMVVRFN